MSFNQVAAGRVANKGEVARPKRAPGPSEAHVLLVEGARLVDQRPLDRDLVDVVRTECGIERQAKSLAKRPETGPDFRAARAAEAGDTLLIAGLLSSGRNRPVDLTRRTCRYGHRIGADVDTFGVRDRSDLYPSEADAGGDFGLFGIEWDSFR